MHKHTHTHISTRRKFIHLFIYKCITEDEKFRVGRNGVTNSVENYKLLLLISHLTNGHGEQIKRINLCEKFCGNSFPMAGI